MALPGRCLRYGQKHDVGVVNFLNKRNAADQRVTELLSEKLRLFDGVFGASDEVLGALESGMDIERRIAEVYQTCRNEEEIAAAFDAIQAEPNEQIQSRLGKNHQAYPTTSTRRSRSSTGGPTTSSSGWSARSGISTRRSRRSAARPGRHGAFVFTSKVNDS